MRCYTLAQTVTEREYGAQARLQKCRREGRRTDMNREKLYSAADLLKRKKKIVIPAAIFTVAAAAFLAGRGGKSSSPVAMGMGQMNNVATVSAEYPKSGDIKLETAVTGTVEPADVVYVYAQESGDVTSVQVKAGDVVEAGQVLLTIDTKQVESAKNSMDSAKISYDQAQSTLNRMQLLYAGGDISDQEYEEYQNQVKSARLQYESAKLNYENQVEYSTVTAPIAGKVESCDVEVFDNVNVSAQLCVISGEGEQRVSFSVTERVAKNLSVGDEIRIEKDGAEYRGFITEVSGMVDAATGMFKVKASMDQADEVPTGSTVKIYVVSEEVHDAMTVPVDAVYFDGGVGNVYVYEDGTVHKKEGEVGIFDSELAEIKAGLTENDLVISTWSSELYEGSTVKLKDDSEGTGTDADMQTEETADKETDGREQPLSPSDALPLEPVADAEER